MKNSGLLPWLKSTFEGIAKMLTGEKFLINVRAFRFAMLELIRNHVEELESFEDFDNIPGIMFIQKCCKFHETCNVDVNLHSC